MQTKIVEFDNGAEVTVNDQGEIEEADVPDEYDQFFSELEKHFPVEREAKRHGFIGGNGGEGMLISDNNSEANIVGIIKDSDVDVKHFWPSYEDESDLALFIALI